MTKQWRSIDAPSARPSTAARPSRCPDDEQVDPDAPVTTPRRFQLARDTDITGVSGTGIVADGVVWPDRTVSIRWRGARPSTVFWQNGMQDVEAVHGHGGNTRIVWLDGAA